MLTGVCQILLFLNFMRLRESRGNADVPCQERVQFLVDGIYQRFRKAYRILIGFVGFATAYLKYRQI